MAAGPVNSKRGINPFFIHSFIIPLVNLITDTNIVTNHNTDET